MGLPRTWLIGESNPYGADPYYALYPLPPHASGGRLMRILGLDENAYLAAFERRNLLIGNRWSAPAARRAAVALLGEVSGGQVEPEWSKSTTIGAGKLVLLGAKVAGAFGLDYRASLLSPVRLLADGVLTPVLVIPHPSGLNRAWADPALAPRVRASVHAFRREEV